MWSTRCTLLDEDEEGLKFTKIDNEIRELYNEKDKFLAVDQALFALPLAKILSQTVSTKEARLLGLQAAKTRWKGSQDMNTLENAVNPDTRNPIPRNAERTKAKKRNKRKPKAPRKKTPRPA